MNNILNEGSTVTSGEYSYRILKFIGKGASAAAYMAECSSEGLVSTCILKEYYPSKLKTVRNEEGSLSCGDEEDFRSGMERFIRSGYKQNEIRQKINMKNQTPPVSRIFEANGTAYIDAACYDGTTLDRLTGLSLAEYIQIILSVSRNVSAYHSSGCLCLDLKPENIFIMSDPSGNAVTGLAEFIDFDSVRTEGDIEKYLYYTREWAAPEQTDSFSASKVCEASDIYTLGELVFWICFGRHSGDSEHRGFSKYSFDKCRNEFRAVLSRPSVQRLLTVLFRNTLRSSVSNRFSSVDDVIMILLKLAEETGRKDFVVPVFPHVSPFFVGRSQEISWISENLRENSSVWVYGTGGIGKSTIVRNYIHQNKAEYDVIIYLEYNDDIIKTFNDDRQLKISNIRKEPGEDSYDYFRRKLEMLSVICKDRDVLIVIDNFEGLIQKEYSELIGYGWHFITVSRRTPPYNSFASLEITAISDTEDIYRLINHNAGRTLSKNEISCFDRIIEMTEGHTLVLELISRQIRAGKISVSAALELIEKNGFSRFSDDKISSYKDGEEIYDTLSVIISELFSRSRMYDISVLYMKVLSLADSRGLERSIIRNIIKLDDNDIFRELAEEGWICYDDVIRVHPVIAETVCSWPWPDYVPDIMVMKLHKRMIAVYEGMADPLRILKITGNADEYAEYHKRDIIIAMLNDMTASLYDTLLGGAYDSESQEDLEIIINLKKTMIQAVEYASSPQDTEEKELLFEYLLSLAGICIRTGKNSKNTVASECISRAGSLISPDFENYKADVCTYNMVSAWYYTLTEYDIRKAHGCLEKAAEYAYDAFSDPLEFIDIYSIPAADILFTLGENGAADAKLSEAADICRDKSDILQYADKLAELLRCRLDVYFEECDYAKCEELIFEIDEINRKYSDRGICRRIDPFIIKTIFGSE